MANYATLVPAALYKECIPTGGKYDFLYIGRRSVEKLRDCWLADAEGRVERGLMSDSLDERMALIAEAQYCRGRAKILNDLAMDAENKPSIFRELPTEAGSRITCALPWLNGIYADCVLMRAVKDKDGALVYEVRVIDKRPRFKKLTQTICFRPSLVSVIPTEDWHYLKCHPNFFKLYLSVVCANSQYAEKRVKKAVASVS